MVAVRSSMSMAPLPQTTPSTSSPPKGSRCQSSGLAGTTSVWPRRVSEGAAGSDPAILATSEARPGCWLVELHVRFRALEVGGQQVGAPALLTRIPAPVVHARVADQLLQQLGRFVHAGRLGDHRLIL